MKYRRFGRTGWNVSEIGYGMWGMAGWSGSEDQQSLDSLQRSIDLGCNFFDTAWAYGDGHSEQLLGKILRANRGKTLYTATKSRRKIASGPARRNSSSTIAIRRNTSRSISTKASRTSACRRST
jgi:aryl-alcohol dehydrogenase-like predicted oxidoreductase